MKKARTNTSENSSIRRSDGITVSFGKYIVPGSSTSIFDVKFHFEKDSKFNTEAHFHVAKTEYLYVERGTARVTVDGVARITDSSHGQIEILPWTSHSWEVLGGEETIVLERTVPADGTKEAFFRNLYGILNENGSIMSSLQGFKIFADWDNYPVGRTMPLMKTLVFVWTRLMGCVAGICGYRSLYKEYTPKELYDRLSR